MEQQTLINHLKSYQSISEMLKVYRYEEILDVAAALCEVPIETLERYPMGGYTKGKTAGGYRYALQDLQKNILSYDWLFARLEDENSRTVFSNLIKYRVLPLQPFLETAYDGVHPQYFDSAIVSCDQEEVFVDCGGFIGDTTEEYIRQFKNYKHIYVYEPSPENVQTCRNNLAKYANVSVRPCGVGERREILSFQGSGASGTFVTEEHGGQEIENISLDEDIEEKVTFIKMDIEGAEISALLGAKRHIREEFPKLAICTYYIFSDLWEIPKLIDTIHPGYRFYIRHYHRTQNWKTVLYAIPPKQDRAAAKACSEKTVVAMAPYERGWSNVELVKDCGLVPYIMHQKYGYKVSMVGADNGPYPYHERYTKGVEMDFLPNGQEIEKICYIEKHAGEIDGLLLRGCYPTNFMVAKAYKFYNPCGRIYVGLDANSSWMDRIIWEDKNFAEFMNYCDVIATSCRALQKHLNEKWPWKIEYIPNGWYDFTHRQKPPIYEEKENVILTVGRLGTRQKATEVLLEAFAEIAGKVPDWKMRLVGSVEKEFEAYIQAYIARFPKIAHRVEFVGTITDREKLFSEYRKAKIFALSSEMEGGPNVVAEALFGGCVTAVSKFDAFEEATDFRRCGLEAEIRDVGGFADILLKLCKDENLKQMSEHAYRYARRHYDMENIVARVNEMLFGGE